MDGRVVTRQAIFDGDGIAYHRLVSPPYVYDYNSYITYENGIYIFHDKIIAWAQEPVFPDANVIVSDESMLPKKVGLSDIMAHGHVLPYVPPELCNIIEQFVPTAGIHTDTTIAACPHMRFHPQLRDYSDFVPPWAQFRYVYVKTGCVCNVQCVDELQSIRGLRPCDMDAMPLTDIHTWHKLKFRRTEWFAPSQDGLMLEQGSEILYVRNGESMHLGTADRIELITRDTAIFTRLAKGKQNCKHNQAAKFLYIVDPKRGRWGRYKLSGELRSPAPPSRVWG
jgi:hypothetical protein